MTGGDIAAIKGVGLLGCRKSGILPNCPGAKSVHRCIRASQVGFDAGSVMEMFHPLISLLGIKRIYLDLLHGFVDPFTGLFSGLCLDLSGPVIARGPGFRRFVGDFGKVRLHWNSE